MNDEPLNFVEFCKFDNFEQFLKSESFEGGDSTLSFIWSNLWYFIVGIAITLYKLHVIDPKIFGTIFWIMIVYIPIYYILAKPLNAIFRLSRQFISFIIYKCKCKYT